MDLIQTYPSPLGEMLMASNGDGLSGLWFRGQKYFAAGLSPDAEEGSCPVFEQTVRWLDCYFCGRVPDFTPKLSLHTSPFRRSVYGILLTIPHGGTMTYGEIAAALARETGRPHMSAQAVGGAVGHNPVSLIIPCHRVIGADGSLTGYAGGLEKKIRLLELEGSRIIPHHRGR